MRKYIYAVFLLLVSVLSTPLHSNKPRRKWCTIPDEYCTTYEGGTDRICHMPLGWRCDASGKLVDTTETTTTTMTITIPYETPQASQENRVEGHGTTMDGPETILTTWTVTYPNDKLLSTNLPREKVREILDPEDLEPDELKPRSAARYFSMTLDYKTNLGKESQSMSSPVIIPPRSVMLQKAGDHIGPQHEVLRKQETKGDTAMDDHKNSFSESSPAPTPTTKAPDVISTSTLASLSEPTTITTPPLSQTSDHCPKSTTVATKTIWANKPVLEVSCVDRARFLWDDFKITWGPAWNDQAGCKRLFHNLDKRGLVTGYKCGQFADRDTDSFHMEARGHRPRFPKSLVADAIRETFEDANTLYYRGYEKRLLCERVRSGRFWNIFG